MLFLNKICTLKSEISRFASHRTHSLLSNQSNSRDLYLQSSETFSINDSNRFFVRFKSLLLTTCSRKYQLNSMLNSNAVKFHFRFKVAIPLLRKVPPIGNTCSSKRLIESASSSEARSCLKKADINIRETLLFFESFI